MIVDFTMTAMARPDIIKQTLDSFSKNLIGIDFKNSTLHINIEPVPENVNRDDIVKLCYEYFGDVNFRMPDEPNYTAAYKFVWSEIKTEFCFNLEDDWIVTEKIQVSTMLDKLNTRKTMNNTLKQLIIENPKKLNSTVCCPIRPYAYNYKTCPTSPALWKSFFLKKVANALDITQNPETQLHVLIKKWFIKQYMSVNPYSDKILAKDIGREWINKTDYISPRELPDNDPRKLKKCYFIKWVKKNG